MKKLYCIILAAGLLFSMSGCSDSKSNSTTSSVVESEVDLPIDSAKNLMIMAGRKSNNCEFKLTDIIEVNASHEQDSSNSDSFIPPISFTYNVTTEGQLNNNRVHANQVMITDNESETKTEVEMYTQVDQDKSDTVTTVDGMAWYPSTNNNELAAVATIFSNPDSFENVEYKKEDSSYKIELPVNDILSNNMLGTFMTNYINQIFQNNKVTGTVTIKIDNDLHLTNLSMDIKSSELSNISSEYKEGLKDFNFNAKIDMIFSDFGTVDHLKMPGKLD